MKMKKGLGSIPKSLSWIDSSEPTVPEIQELKQSKKQKQKSSAFVEKVSEPIVETIQEKRSHTIEISPLDERSTSMHGLPVGWTRATFIIKQEINEKIKAVAYWDRLTVKEVLHEALSQYLQDKNVRSIPKKKETL